MEEILNKISEGWTIGDLNNKDIQNLENLENLLILNDNVFVNKINNIEEFQKYCDITKNQQNFLKNTYEISNFTIFKNFYQLWSYVLVEYVFQNKKYKILDDIIGRIKENHQFLVDKELKIEDNQEEKDYSQLDQIFNDKVCNIWFIALLKFWIKQDLNKRELDYKEDHEDIIKCVYELMKKVGVKILDFREQDQEDYQIKQYDYHNNDNKFINVLYYTNQKCNQQEFAIINTQNNQQNKDKEQDKEQDIEQDKQQDKDKEQEQEIQSEKKQQQNQQKPKMQKILLDQEIEEEEDQEENNKNNNNALANQQDNVFDDQHENNNFLFDQNNLKRREIVRENIDITSKKLQTHQNSSKFNNVTTFKDNLSQNNILYGDLNNSEKQFKKKEEKIQNKQQQKELSQKQNNYISDSLQQNNNDQQNDDYISDESYNIIDQQEQYINMNDSQQLQFDPTVRTINEH